MNLENTCTYTLFFYIVQTARRTKNTLNGYCFAQVVITLMFYEPSLVFILKQLLHKI